MSLSVSNAPARAALALVLVLVVAAFTPPPLGDPLIGFSSDSSEAQLALEERFDTLLDADNLDRWMRQLSANPQHVGSPQARANAEFVRDLFDEWGYDAEIVRYDVLFPTPRERVLELVHPDRVSLHLDEPAIEEDPYSSNRAHMLPPYNAYSADGDVTAELVYVNQGIPRDYEELERMGISVEGKIVIARYGGSWRGIKPKVAAEHGAVGCILYSDPLDDGYWRGDVYPEGAFKMGMGVQRGSVADMPMFPGDPLTPGVGATEDAERLSREDAPTIMDIPVLPISYENALPLLEAIGGPVAPAAWRGALPTTYHVGPGPARVHLRLAFDWELTPAFNVIARLEGDEHPDEWVIRGNHRDAWVFGASDPTSGHVTMMEEARAIAALAAEGHRPDRTVIYASWDAEEPGLLGSTEWVEHHADELREKAVAYVNTDGYGRGFLGMGGSHTLEPFINQVARDVNDPQTGVSVLERAIARVKAGGEDEPLRGGDLPIRPLGSGSDYTPFLQHMGVSSLNLGFGGENAGGSYHSLYDTYDHYVRFGDPGFVYGVALVKVTGRTTLRLANADVLPFRFEPFVRHVRGYLDEVEELAETMREERDRHNRMVEDGTWHLALDPEGDVMPPPSRPAVPFIALDEARNAFTRLEAAARRADAALADASASDDLNEALAQVERSMTDEAGLPRRPWFRHQIYAPGFYTGYGVKTLPGIREAVEEEEWAEFEAQLMRLAERFRRIAAAIDAVT
ncbi:MAG: M28 family peptidase, partial [Rhodothermales bacterium]|nr:M28 family peptidase [Rhodothermales bacterium]